MLIHPAFYNCFKQWILNSIFLTLCPPPLFFAVGSFAEFSLGAEISTVALTEWKSIQLKKPEVKKHHKNRTPFFLTLHSAPLFLLAGDLWQWERRCQIQPVGWDIHCGTDIAEHFNWRNKRWRRIVKSRPPFFSYLAFGIPVTVCCWLCSNESGGAKFSLRAEISTVAWT